MLDLPTILDSQVNRNKASFKLYVNEDLAYFQGHFNDFALVPGVVQIGWALKLASVYKRELIFGAMDKVKFTHPITPNTQLSLDLELPKDSTLLSFKYFNNLQQFSSGKIRIGGQDV